MNETTASAKAKDKLSGKPKESAGRQKSPAEPSFNMDELRALAALVDEHGFTDFEFENENIRVRLSKASPTGFIGLPHGPFSSQSYPIAGEKPHVPTPHDSKVTTPDTPPEADVDKITSPIVGTFYRSAGPDKEPYVKLGDYVTPETVVCIVEAMKLMNEIQAETTGEVVKIFVENAQPVEYGQPLFGIKK